MKYFAFLEQELKKPDHGLNEYTGARKVVKLNNDEIYLLDSGGQYKDGTTDITRTAHFGGKAPTAF